MLTWCLCLSVWFKNSISVRDAAAEKPSEGRGRMRTSACSQVSITAAKHKTDTHLSDIRSYLTSLRIMAPFRGCHRVQCCVMRLFTLKKRKKSTKKSDKHVLKNSAWNEWHKTLYIPVFVKACLPLCTPIFFSHCSLSHIDPFKYSKHVCPVVQREIN